MALDESLLRSAASPLLRCYQWREPAVSFGYFVRLEEVQRSWPGREPVRRWTGGGIVPHSHDFTYSLLVPREHPIARLSAPETYLRIHGAVAETLAKAGGGEAGLAGAPGRKVSEACFDNPAENDVLWQGRKIAGGAQRRSTAGLLHQGSIQLAAVFAGDSEFAKRLAAALADSFKTRSLTSAELAAGEELARSKYGTAEWLRRI